MFSFLIFARIKDAMSCYFLNLHFSDYQCLASHILFNLGLLFFNFSWVFVLIYMQEFLM